MSAAPIRVLVVDDSAVMRRVLGDALGRHADIEVVGKARDPFEARELIVALDPDVVTLDIEMPRMDGLTFLTKLMAARPTRVVIVSSVAPTSGANAVRAISLGALDVVCKPEGPVDAAAMGEQLARTIRDAAKVPVARLHRVRPAAEPRVRPVVRPAPNAGAPSARLIALGASTGGPGAIEELLGGLDEHTPGLLIVQHMPRHFTAAFAQRLDGIAAMRVQEARDGAVIRDGHAYVAPGGRHLQVRRCADGFMTVLKDGPVVHHQRPAVDVLFDSVVRVADASTVGVLLTGMGSDGGRGLRALRDAGAWTIAQDESTCVVYGMPRVAAELGGACEILPLERIAGAITRRAGEQAIAAGGEGRRG